MGANQNAGSVVRLKDGRTRRFRSKLERRQIVEETQKPGASVSLVARAHDVNANQVFKWRKQYRQGRLEIDSGTTLLPVKVSDTIQTLQTTPRRTSRTKRSGVIEIDLGHARVRIEGTADPECVRAAVEGLIRKHTNLKNRWLAPWAQGVGGSNPLARFKINELARHSCRAFSLGSDRCGRGHVQPRETQALPRALKVRGKP
jgi:transposase